MTRGTGRNETNNVEKLSFVLGKHGGKILPFIPCDNTPNVYEQGRDLKLVIRTDASFSTARLKSHLCKSLGDSTAANFNFSVANVNGSVGQEAYVQRLVHSAYEMWGHSMLKAIVNNVDYEAYGVDTEKSEVVEIEFYNAKSIADQAIGLGSSAVSGAKSFFISFDEMIRPQTEEQKERWGDLGFSRLFSMDGRERYDYVGRPGKGAIGDQIDVIKDRLKELYDLEGEKVQIVLLEDNVRHAKMINWAIEQMNEHGVFEYAEISALSTCFCCASEEERQKVKFNGKPVPILPVSDYKDDVVDVITPRDLMFDGIVVELAGKHTRLPALFMDLEQRMGIKVENQQRFIADVVRANVLFCDTIRNAFDFEPPVSWFIQPEAIEEVTGLSGDMPMKDLMLQIATSLPLPDNSVQAGNDRHISVS